MSFTYKGLSAQREQIAVTDSDIDRHIERLRRQSPAINVIENRASALGDELVLDYSGVCDGVPFAGGTAQNQTLTLGSGAFIPGFEEQLLGKRPGESVTVRVTFPTDYPHDHLAGKEAEFACTIREIRTRSEYALDDRFAQEVGHCASLAQMREAVGESLRAYYDERAEQELQDHLIRQAAATLPFTPDEAQLEEAVEAQMETLRAQLAQRGLTMEAYCSFTGSTEEELRKDFLPEAEQSVRIQAAIARIAALEGIEAEEPEIAGACAALCRKNHITAEQLQAVYDDTFAEAVRRSVVAGKVLRFVRDAAEITEIHA